MSKNFIFHHSQQLLNWPVSQTVCGAKYKTRPGLTYHFTHTHKEAAAAAAAASGAAAATNSDGDSRDSRGGAHTPPVSSLGPATEYQDSYVTFLNNPAGAPSNGEYSVLRRIIHRLVLGACAETGSRRASVRDIEHSGTLVLWKFGIESNVFFFSGIKLDIFNVSIVSRKAHK